MRVRAAKVDDAASIARIWNTVIRDTAITFTTIEKTEADVADLIAGADACFVIADTEMVQGFALIGPFRAGPGYAGTKEVTVYLEPGAKGRGDGTRLLTAIETEAHGLGVTRLIAGIGGENADAKEFFAARGFETVGILDGVGQKFDRPMDLVLMMKRLNL